MADDPARKLELRLVPADGAPPDAQVFDDLVRLIRQGIATAPKQYPQISNGSGFRPPTDEEKRDLSAVEAQIKHRIDDASKASEADVAKRAETAKLPDADQRLADEALAAAQLVVAAVQRALIQGVKVTAPDPDSPPDAPR